MACKPVQFSQGNTLLYRQSKNRNVTGTTDIHRNKSNCSQSSHTLHGFTYDFLSFYLFNPQIPKMLSRKQNNFSFDYLSRDETAAVHTMSPLCLLPLCPTNGTLSSAGLLLVGCFTSQQQASVSQGRICSDNFTCCHTEIEAADQTFYLTQSQYTDTGPTSPSADPITPGAWQSSYWSANV